MEAGNRAKMIGRAREIAALTGLTAMWAVVGRARWSGLPQRIPVHFGIDGKPDA